MRRSHARGWRSAGGARTVALGAIAAVAVALAGCGSGSGTTRTHELTASAPTTSTATQVLPGTGRPQVTLGDKNTPEQFVLGALYDQALTAQGYDVNLTRNIGPSTVSFQAIEQGSLDIYPEYLNVWNTQVAGESETFHSLSAAYQAGENFAAEHGMYLLNPTPFSNTNAIAVTTPYAQANHLRSLSDLRRVATSLTLGAPIEFSQVLTGLPALESAYGFLPVSTQPITIGSQYDALRSGTIQAAFVETTDGELASSEFQVLRDPRHVMGYGNVVPVVSTSTLAAEGPEFSYILNQVDALLTTVVMRELNADVEIYHQDPVAVAHQFLLAHGLIPASGTA